jgi:hypothetical protein
MDGFVPELILGGVSAIIGVVLIVESLKRLGVAKNEEGHWLSFQRAALLTGVVLGAAALAADPAFPNGRAEMIQTVSTYLFGGIASGLAYDLAGDAFFAWLQGVVDAVFNRVS